MPRRIGDGDQVNELRLFDNISQSEIVLYYRMPTTTELTGYANESIQRRRGKIVFQQPQARLKYGARILTGFRAGDFERKQGGAYVPMASDPQSEHYAADWKEHLVKYAPDLIMVLAAHVFDAPAEIGENGTDGESAPGGEDAEKN